MARVAPDSQLEAKTLAMIVQLEKYLLHFPRHQKYALSNTLRNLAQEIYLQIATAQKSYHKKTPLRDLDIAHERLRRAIVMANELGYFRFRHGKQESEGEISDARRRYLYISALVDEVGRLIGGWIREVRAQEEAESRPRRK